MPNIGDLAWFDKPLVLTTRGHRLLDPDALVTISRRLDVIAAEVRTSSGREALREMAELLQIETPRGSYHNDHHRTGRTAMAPSNHR